MLNFILDLPHEHKHSEYNRPCEFRYGPSSQEKSLSTRIQQDINDTTPPRQILPSRKPNLNMIRFATTIYQFPSTQKQRTPPALPIWSNIPPANVKQVSLTGEREKNAQKTRSCSFPPTQLQFKFIAHAQTCFHADTAREQTHTPWELKIWSGQMHTRWWRWDLL